MLPIKVIPAAIDFLKATDLVQAMAPAVDFKTRNKLDDAFTVTRPTSLGGPYTEPQPTLCVVQAHRAWSLIRMPGRQQIGLVAEYEAAVARAH